MAWKIWDIEEVSLTFLPSMKESEEEKEKEEFAALKIQSAFRGHKAREEVKKMKSDNLEKGEENE
jgi:hypothetical protein